MNRLSKLPIAFLLIFILVIALPVGFAAISGVSVTPTVDSVTHGQDAIFSITVSNNNKSTALGTTFSIEGDSLLGEFTPKTLDLRKNQSGTVTLTIPTVNLESGGSYSFRIKASAPEQTRQPASEWISDQVTFTVMESTNDIEAPVTNLSITNGTLGVNGWYKTDIGIRLTATDSGGSGVKEIRYVLNEGLEKVSYGEQVDIIVNTEGSNSLRYWAIDNAGNVENFNNADYSIDKSLPVVQVSATKSDGTYYTGGTTSDQDVTVRFEVEDANLASFKVDGEEWYTSGTTAIGNVVVTNEGSTTILYVAQDQAGNSTSGQFVVVIDKTIQEPTGIHYVALGDSIATGSTSRGKTTSYVYGFYNHLKLKDSNATMKNLSVDGDRSYDLLRRLGEEAFRAEVQKADVITLTIGGNNVMDAARASSFSSIDKAIAEAGTTAFEAEYDLIVQAIREVNPSAEIIAVTLYNPYNSVKITGYTNDPVLRAEAEFYISRINAKIVGISNDSRYRVVDVHNYFKVNYADKGRMGDITYFYPFYWFSFSRDPHPNQTGQNVITNLHKAAYPLY
jgi:lysophospholipase L1-like esterase